MTLTQDWRDDLVIFVVVLTFIVVSIIIPKMLKEKGIISKHTARKMVHNISGLAVFSSPFLHRPVFAFVIALIMTILTKLSSQHSKSKPLKELFDAISEEEELKIGYLQGPFAYCLAITILTFLFLFRPDEFYFPIASILIMMYSDSLAASVGRKYGTHHINVPGIGNKRTVEGSLAFFTSALGISLFVFYILGDLVPGFSNPLNSNEIWFYSFILSIVATGLELISPSKYDDLIIPLGATLITWSISLVVTF